MKTKNPKIKRITPKMLDDAAKEFYEWYGVKIPYTHMVKFAENCSYDDLCYFDTGTRERLADFIGEKVVGDPWPMGADGEKKGNKFFASLKKNCRRFGIQFDQ